MGLYLVGLGAATLLACYFCVRKFNGWFYEMKVRKKKCSLPLPPGDMGWPFIGNLIPFLRDFSFGRPDSFINNIFSKYGRGGIYKTHLLGKPCIIVSTPEMAKQVLTDDENFILGYPKSVEFIECKPLAHVSSTEHKRLRRLITAPILGYNVLAKYVERIEKIVINSLEELSSMKHPVQLYKEMEKISFKVIVHIFIGSHNQPLITKIQDLFNQLSNSNPLFSVAINLPGFAFHRALKIRKKLFEVLLSAVNERRMLIKNVGTEGKKDLVDILLEIKGENGERFEDEDIVSTLILFLFAGFESTAGALMWSLVYLMQHPHVFRKAKEEQEEIVKARPPCQNHLNHNEIKRMVYLSKVINELLRRVNIAFSNFREAINDVNINGYIIPKGWKVIVWGRSIHMNPEYYPNPEEFNPSRWDDYNGKAGTFIPFGLGSRLCPGSDISKLEISILLHHFLLNYRMERMNPECPISSLPYDKPKDNCLVRVIRVSPFN